MGQIGVVKFFATLSRDLRKLFPQVAEELPKVPWSHHRLLIDKFKLLFGDYSLLLLKCLEK